MSDLEEAIQAGKQAYFSADTIVDGKAVRAAILAAAPIIQRQTLQRITDLLRSDIATHEAAYAQLEQELRRQ